MICLKLLRYASCQYAGLTRTCPKLYMHSIVTTCTKVSDKLIPSTDTCSNTHSKPSMFNKCQLNLLVHWWYFIAST